MEDYKKYRTKDEFEAFAEPCKEKELLCYATMIRNVKQKVIDYTAWEWGHVYWLIKDCGLTQAIRCFNDSVISVGDILIMKTKEKARDKFLVLYAECMCNPDDMYLVYTVGIE